jgi:hypothetical protein
MKVEQYGFEVAARAPATEPMTTEAMILAALSRVLPKWTPSQDDMEDAQHTTVFANAVNELAEVSIQVSKSGIDISFYDDDNDLIGEDHSTRISGHVTLDDIVKALTVARIKAMSVCRDKVTSLNATILALQG